jgi:hypothetical protein
MKKLVLTISLILTNLFGQTKPFPYVDLYGEIQMNMVLANKCLEEVAFSHSVEGQSCSLYANIVDTSVYKRVLKVDFSELDTKGTFWTKEDWIILKNQMKKLIYTTDLIRQNPY